MPVYLSWENGRELELCPRCVCVLTVYVLKINVCLYMFICMCMCMCMSDFSDCSDRGIEKGYWRGRVEDLISNKSLVESERNQKSNAK